MGQNQSLRYWSLRALTGCWQRYTAMQRRCLGLLQDVDRHLHLVTLGSCCLCAKAPKAQGLRREKDSTASRLQTNAYSPLIILNVPCCALALPELRRPMSPCTEPLKYSN
eukprot:1978722-Amphidinium_carterae.1